MNNGENNGLNRSLFEQRKDQGWCNFACIHKVVSNFSALCSLAGASLFGAIFFRLTDMLDYRNTRLVYECAHCMVIAAVVLFCLAFLLSFFKEDSKLSNPVDVTLVNVRESVQFENNGITNSSTNKLNLTDKLKLVESNTKIKQCAISENIMPIATSSKILKFSIAGEQEHIVERTSSCKNLNVDQSKQKETVDTLLPNTLSKTDMHAGIPKQGESKRNLSLDTSSKTLQHTSTSKQQESAKILSPNISSKMLEHANVAEQKPQTLSTRPLSQTMSDAKPLHNDRQLVPYDKPPQIPFYGQNLQTSPAYQGRNFFAFMSPNASGYCPVTEITATKRMTVAPWGVTQVEHKVHRRTFYHDPQNPIGAFSTEYGQRQPLNQYLNSGGVQEYQMNQTTFYQHPPHAGARISSIISTPNLDNDQNGMSSSMFNQPRQNKVSDVLKRLEAMNIFH